MRLLQDLRTGSVRLGSVRLGTEERGAERLGIDPKVGRAVLSALSLPVQSSHLVRTSRGGPVARWDHVCPSQQIWESMRSKRLVLGLAIAAELDVQAGTACGSG